MFAKYIQKKKKKEKKKKKRKREIRRLKRKRTKWQATRELILLTFDLLV